MLVGVQAGAQTDPAGAAARFDRAQALYSAGKFAEAIKEFEAAHALAPHSGTLFSIARCHENMGDIARALSFYQRAFDAETDPGRKKDIGQRMATLRLRPVKLFLNSSPSGAVVTVDARERPEEKRTPLLVRLRAGSHVLLLKKDGYLLTVKRVMIEAGKDTTADVELRPAPRPTSLPTPPPPRKCPEGGFISGKDMKLNLGVMAGVGLSNSRPFSATVGLKAHAFYRRFVFGGRFQLLSFVTTTIAEKSTKNSDIYLDRNSPAWLIVQAEGGYMVPFRTAYLYGTVGLGVSFERHKFSGTEKKIVQAVTTDESFSRVINNVGFVWSLGGGVQAKVQSWLSIGGSLRVGMVHGERVKFDDPDEVESTIHTPYGSLSLLVTFHI